MVPGINKNQEKNNEENVEVNINSKSDKEKLLQTREKIKSVECDTLNFSVPPEKKPEEGEQK